MTIIPIVNMVLKKKMNILFLSLNFKLYNELKLFSNKCYQDFFVPKRWLFGSITNFNSLKWFLVKKNLNFILLCQVILLF